MSHGYKCEPRTDGPKGFGFAVTDRNKAIAWCRAKEDAELLEWAKMMELHLEGAASRDTISLLWDYFSRLERRMRP